MSKPLVTAMKDNLKDSNVNIPKANEARVSWGNSIVEPNKSKLTDLESRIEEII